jgi:hypothetical protein
MHQISTVASKRSTHWKSAKRVCWDHLNRQWILDTMNRIYRIGDGEPGTLPLSFGSVEKSVSARDVYNFDALWFRGSRPLLQDISCGKKHDLTFLLL